MPEIRMTCALSGPDTNHVAGDVIDVDTATAARFVEAGIAEHVDAAPKRSKRSNVETGAAVDPVETASA